ncbi:hypothetical protein [Phytoactinopolyspora endophytica]|uniref:hypothetical protein n=1 Tax=Phytoactinopolyspora endophytica TaxID=1642495 RepID=UPI00197C6CE5|nr:hypothetical protein [Phytoactinopolyspora endophytica]
MSDTAGVRRRPVLLTIAGTPLLGAALTACTSEPAGKRVGDTSEPDPDARVRWDAVQAEQDLLALHVATVAAHDNLRDLIEPIAIHHRRHLESLLDDGPLPYLLTPEIDPRPGGDAGRPDNDDEITGNDDSAGDGADAGDDGDSEDAGESEDDGDDVFALDLGMIDTPDIPDDPGNAVEAIIEAERAASESHVASCLLAADPRLAALLSSIAAAEATHDVALRNA